MPRPRNATPTYRYHSQSGQAVSDFYDPLTGKKRCVSLGKWNSPESRKEHARVVAEVANGRSAQPGRLTVAEVCLAYLKFAATYYVKNGQPTDEVAGLVAAVKPLRLLYAHTPAADFGPVALRTVQARMIEIGMSRQTVNKQVGRLRRMFRWAVAEAMVPAAVLTALEAVAPLKKGRTTAKESPPVRPVADAVIDATLPHLTPVVAAMVRVQRLTGMRPNEVVQLRPSDLDRSGAVWRYTPGTHKTEHRGRPRVIAIGPRAQAVLAPYLDRDAGAYCFDPRESVAWARSRVERRGGLGSRKGKKAAPMRYPRTKYDSDSYRRAVERGARKAGVEVWTPNRIRHAYGTQVRKELGLEAAQVGLGHERADVTQIYAEKNLDLADRIAAEIG